MGELSIYSSASLLSGRKKKNKPIWVGNVTEYLENETTN